ncbi:MAG: hypothetical protein ACE3JK_08020 [Sporolactobacillus sp.]
MIPFYREDRHQDKGYTLFLDRKTGRVYKAYHRKVNQMIYWTATVLTLAFLRELNGLYFVIKAPFIMLVLIILEVMISLLAGYAMYKMYFHNRMKEIYITPEMLEDYGYKGRPVLKKDTIILIILTAVFIFFILLYIMTYWLIWLIASFALAVLTSYLLCFFSKAGYEICGHK